MKIRTVSCVRYVFIRYGHCYTHDVERVNGIEAALAAPASTSHPTTTGRKMASRLDPASLLRFATGAYVLMQPAGVEPIVFEEPLYFTDGSDAARETARCACWPEESSSSFRLARTIAPPSDEASCVRLVFLLGSSLTIVPELTYYGVVPGGFNVGLPVGSITMFDVIGGSCDDAFIHCVGNTALNPDVCWWHNSE